MKNNLPKDTTYISIDIESDGPIPGKYSMLSFGAAAFSFRSEDPREPFGEFYTNLQTLPGAIQSEDTMKFWARNPVAWNQCTSDPQDPNVMMPEFIRWASGFENPILMGYPVTFDFNFIQWYSLMFGGLSDGVLPPWGFQGLDIKTMAMSLMGCDYKEATKRNMPKKWFTGLGKHNHNALDDAIEQGKLFMNMRMGG